MGWSCSTVESQREEFVSLALAQGSNVRELCRRFGISPATGYKWIKRGRLGEGFADVSRRPKSSPKKTEAALEALIIANRRENPTWGARKLHRDLSNQGHTGLPSPTTITEILRRNRLLSLESQEPRDFVSFERETPNELWQMDFKGHFGITSGQRCHPLTILDDHSRYILCIKAIDNERTLEVQNALTEVFKLYGLPKGILCDNGSPWGSQAEHRLTPLGVWLMRLDVSVYHGRPYHPQTQGKLERFHQTLKADVLSLRTFEDLSQCQREFDAYKLKYNHRRPHESLNLATPSSRYAPSARSFPSSLPEPEYDLTDVVRKVSKPGVVNIDGHARKVPDALIGQRIGLRPTTTDGVYDVVFARRIVSQVDLRYNETS